MQNEIVKSLEKQPKTLKTNFHKALQILKVIGLVVIPALLIKSDIPQKDILILDSELAKNTNYVPGITGAREIIKKLEPMKLIQDYLELAGKIDIANADAINILNDPASSNEEFAKQIELWDSEVPIFSKLSNMGSKFRFINFVLSNDDLDTYEYKKVDLGPDIDGDGIIELFSDDSGVTRDEAGQIVDPENPPGFICEDFSLELNRRYGLQNGIPTKPLKYQLPMFQVAVEPGFESDQVGAKSILGHEFNAVFIGNDFSELGDISYYTFIEPQNDKIIIDPMHHLVDGKMFTIFIPHKDDWNTEGDSLNTFFNIKGKFIKVDDRGLQIINELSGWQIMNYNLTPEKDKIFLDEPNLEHYSAEEILSISKLIIKAGYMSQEQVLGALYDAYLPENFKMQDLHQIFDGFEKD